MRVDQKRYLVGIDEAGRGPLAGPVSVAVVALMSRSNLDIGNLDIGMARGTLKDSKKLSAKRREQWCEWLKQKQKSGELQFAASLVGEKIIDRIGIVRAVRLGIKRCLARLDLKPERCRILLDGSLRAPKIYRHQRTIIRGDEKIPLIMLASIIAKVTRDRKMIRLAKNFPQYGFEIHKGYGTRAHYRALYRHGLSPLHRRSFLTRFARKN